MQQHGQQAPGTDHEEFVRMPGLFRRWEFEQVLEPGTDFHIEDAGDASDGTHLFAVYRREQINPNATQEK